LTDGEDLENTSSVYQLVSFCASIRPLQPMVITNVSMPSGTVGTL